VKTDAYREEYAGALAAFFRAAEPSSPPSLSKFAAHIGVPLPQVLEWGERHPAFAEAMENARETLRDRLIDWGLQKACDPNFVKFLLSEPSVLWPVRAAADSVLDVRITVEP